MATTTQNGRTTDPTPLYALVGATDRAVEGVRHALADAARRQAEVRAEVQTQVEHLQAEIGKRRAEVAELLGEPRRLQAGLEQVPGLVLGRALEVAARAETQYEELAARGKSLLERLGTQPPTQDLTSRSHVTDNHAKVTVTTIRPTAEDVTASMAEPAEVTTEATATVRKRATRPRTATKRATTSARKTATAAAETAGSAAKKAGD